MKNPYELRPDYGLDNAILALWRYRHWSAQRHCLRVLLREARTLRRMWRDDQRLAEYERAAFIEEMHHATAHLAEMEGK